MATVKFILQSKKNPANIYLRLSVDRNTVLKRKTGFVIDPNDWSLKTSLPKQGDEDLKKLRTDLNNLAEKIEKSINILVAEGEFPTGDWLQDQIDQAQGKKQKTDNSRLVNYFQHYIDNLPYKEWPNGKRGTTHATLKKYKTIKGKIESFERYMKKTYYLKDVDLNFRNDLIKYFREVDKLNSNSTGRYIRFIKTVCSDAQINGLEVNTQLKLIKGYTEKADKVFLSIDELEQIENTELSRKALINARDWLIIGCYIGQRVSDLLTLTSENIVIRSGIQLIELTQQKTGKRVAIPLHPKVKAIIDRNKGQFPTKISAVHFNLHLKDICKEAKINQLIEGSKINKDTNRKESGIYPKYELITSHVCRRSFATNFYGEMPTALLISITAHSTERQFLEYIGKTSNDYAFQIAEYWHKLEAKAKKEPQMTVLRNAQ